jgi:ATP-binding cassette subfamily B protein
MSVSSGAERVRPPTLRSLWQIVTLRPGLFAFDVLLQIPRQMAFLLPGLVIRECFNLLTRDARVSPDLIWLLVLLVGTGVVRVAMIYASALIDQVLQNFSAALLRANLFRRILQLPGARALPYSPGETITRLGGGVYGWRIFHHGAHRPAGVVRRGAAADRRDRDHQLRHAAHSGISA